MADAGGPFPPDTPEPRGDGRRWPALAAATERVRLATLVFGITYRHPAVLAKWAATTDHVSGGRLLLGLGAGWQENEHEQYGIELGRPGVRVERFDEALQVIRGLLDEPTTTVDGDHYRVTGRHRLAQAGPGAPADPHRGQGRPDARRRGASYADEWNMWSDPAELAERRAVLDQQCERIGRDPGEIATSTQALDDRPRRRRQGPRSWRRRWARPGPAVAGTAGPLRRAGGGLAGRRRRRGDRPRLRPGRPAAGAPTPWTRSSSRWPRTSDEQLREHDEHGPPTEIDLLRWSEALSAIAKTGLGFSDNLYERERFEEVLAVAADIRVASGRAFDTDTTVAEWMKQVGTGVPGYVTPKVAVGAVVGDEDGRILLVQRADSGIWLYPTGWCDVGYSASEVVLKEV